MLKKMFPSLLSNSTFSAAPQAVVFDWGNVLAYPERQPIVDFLCASLAISLEEFEKNNLEKHKSDASEIEFWMKVAREKGISLPGDWSQSYRLVARNAMNVDNEMYALVSELKQKGICVALLSNIQKRYADLIRDFGLYEPFKPCLLSSEIGLKKPDPKAFELLLQKISLPASEIIFIDDLQENIDAAREMGITSLRFETPQQVRKHLVAKGFL